MSKEKVKSKEIISLEGDFIIWFILDWAGTTVVGKLKKTRF